MTDLQATKALVRKVAFARRRTMRAAARADDGAALLSHVIGGTGRIVSGYMPIRTEIDPLPTMSSLVARGFDVCVPVIDGAALPLRFARWHPDIAMEDGAFGARIPVQPEWMEPDTLIVPLLAFDRAGYRLGYGGGFYDRTLERLRAMRPTRAVGFAFAGQEVAAVPREATDQPLDAMVTERGLVPLDRRE